MSRIAYYRVSTGDQSIEAQRKALGGGFDREFADEGVSGGSLAAARPGLRGDRRTSLTWVPCAGQRVPYS